MGLGSQSERSCQSAHQSAVTHESVTSYGGIWKMRSFNPGRRHRLDDDDTPSTVDFTLDSAHSEREIEIARRSARERATALGSIVLIKSLLRDRALRLNRQNVFGTSERRIQRPIPDSLARRSDRSRRKAPTKRAGKFLNAHQIKLSWTICLPTPFQAFRRFANNCRY